MNITVFTSNQARHLSLLRDLAKVCNKVYAIIEVNTVFPGDNDDFFKKSAIMKRYFNNVIRAESDFFGDNLFLNENVIPIVIKMGDLKKIPLYKLELALHSDHYIIFGSSYIKGDLINFLIAHRAINIHMGISPFYRGSSCNFWACYDGNFGFVGATVHLISKNLDSGAILFHALPREEDCAFNLGMRSVAAAHKGIVNYIVSDEINQLIPIDQKSFNEIRYTRNKDFTDDIALFYLDNLPKKELILKSIKDRNIKNFINPYIY